MPDAWIYVTEKGRNPATLGLHGLGHMFMGQVSIGCALQRLFLLLITFPGVFNYISYHNI